MLRIIVVGQYSLIKAQSNASFVNNTASNGGAVYSAVKSSIKFENKSLVQFMHNIAVNSTYSGGAIFQEDHSVILFSTNSLVMLSNNNAYTPTTIL